MSKKQINYVLILYISVAVAGVFAWCMYLLTR